MDTETKNSHAGKFLFNVDILIESESNGLALEKLLHLLNSAEIQDYIVKEGILLGKTIEIAMRESISKQKSDVNKGTSKSAKAITKPSPSTAAKKDETPPVPEDQHQEIWAQFQHFKQDNTLIRLTVVKGKGVRLSMPCRILNADASSGNVSVYHVDEKQVYLFKINEIEDFSINPK